MKPTVMIVEDEASLASIRKKLKPGGKILLTVPANPWMWSAHDTAHHHHRRYTIAGLKDVATKAGLKVHLMSHFNSLLFPVAALARIIGLVCRALAPGGAGLALGLLLQLLFLLLLLGQLALALFERVVGFGHAPSFR